jgi:hypothetical protein
VGYYRPYATSHEDLDRDRALFAEVRNAARSLVEMIAMIRRGDYRRPDRNIKAPRPK